jgi:RNA 2',3'-cyclic 3'-phosphodiesterase
MRAFLAIDTGPEPRPDGAAATGGPPPHLTLRFFAEVGPEAVERLVAAIPEAARAVAPFDLALGGVGAFPTAARPRVVWLGVARGSDGVLELARRVADVLERAGFPREPDAFVPHVTLFRVRSSRDRERAEALLAGRVPAPAPPPVRVREVLLKESRLSAQGAEHRVVRAFPLGGEGREPGSAPT